MDPKVDSLFQEAMTLPEDDRAVLAERILATIPADISQAWLEEAERRVAEIERGRDSS